MTFCALWIIRGSAVYHFLMGGAAMLSPRLIRRLGRGLYALKAPEDLDPRFEYGLKPLGAFALTLALWCTRVGWWGFPEEVRTLTCALALLFTLRAAFRYLNRDLFFRAFGVPWQRSRYNVLFNLILSAVLLLSL